MKSMQLDISTAYDVFQFVVRTIMDNIKKGENSYAYVKHLLSPFFASKRDLKVVREIEKKGRVNYVCRSDSPFDQILAGFYKEFNSKVKLGINLGFDDDLYVVGDLVIRVGMPIKYQAELDDLYFDTKSILSFNMMRFFKDFALKEVKFKVSVERNKDRAEDLRARISKHFNS